jgi:DNA processing protein
MLGVQSLGPLTPRRAAEEASVVAPVVSADPSTAGPSEVACGRPGRVRHDSGRDPGFEPLPVTQPDATIERDAWVVLLSVTGLGPVSFAALLAAFGSARGVLAAASGPDGPYRLLQALADAASDEAERPLGLLDGAIFDACGAPAETDGGQHECHAPHRRRPAIGADLAGRICDAAAGGSRIVERVRGLGLTVVTLDEPSYPERLRLVELPPPLLFVRGRAEALSATSAVAVVGTRRPTDKGRLIAGWIGSALARTGAAVVSGLAVGIDGVAHAAVVAEGGTTVAVLGGGHARLFPKAHERLADAIAQSGGAVVSELAPDTTPTRGTFPRRNRLVSGLSDATVVVEAGRRSGALITAGWALEQGRECFLVPGPLDSPMSAGCNAFLRSFPGQARIVAGIAELIEDLALDGGAVDSPTAGATAYASATQGLSAPTSSASAAGGAAVLATLGSVELALAEQLVLGPATADQLATRTSLAVASVLSALTLLELRGLVRCAFGRYSPAGTLASWSGRGPKSPGLSPPG